MNWRWQSKLKWAMVRNSMPMRVIAPEESSWDPIPSIFQMYQSLNKTA